VRARRASRDALGSAPTRAQADQKSDELLLESRLMRENSRLTGNEIRSEKSQRTARD
jgi:hypothetical protein